MNNKDTGWLSSVSEKPPENILDSDDLEEAMDVNESNDSFSQTVESPVKPASASLSIKNYASSNQNQANKNGGSAATNQIKNKENTIIQKNIQEQSDENERSHLKSKTKLEQPITPLLRRSSRANKGIGKEIFDPSYIPASQKKYHEPKRFDSPNTERSSSPGSSVNSSPSFKKSRIVVGRSPKRAKEKRSPKEKEEKKNERGRGRSQKKVAASTDQSKALLSMDDFSDDDDNVPLKLLKEEEISEYDEEEEDEKEDEVENKKEEELNKIDKNVIENKDDDLADEDVEKEDTSSNKDDPSDDDDDDDSSVDSDDSYNNPERLWCICRKPHNNRFMISCDQCEDWFHGDCVGISLAQGRKMEENNEEYTCPKCRKTLNDDDSAYEPPDLNEMQKKLRRKSSDASTEVKPHRRSVAMDQKLKANRNAKGRTHSINGETAKVQAKLKDKKAKLQTDQVKKDTDSSYNKKSLADTSSKSSSRKCIVSSCTNDALPGSVYCSNQCILKHAKESLMSVVKDKQKEENSKSASKDTKEKPKALNPNRRISVICRKTRKILSGPAAPRRKDLAVFLKKHPNYKIYKQPSSLSEANRPPVSHKQKTKPSSTDFYKHVQSQHRKRDRYGVDSEHAPTFKKVSDSISPLDRKHRVIKHVDQVSSSHKSSNDNAKSGHVTSNRPKYPIKPEHSTSSHKDRTLSESGKRIEGSKTERRTSKDQKRKHSLDSKDDRPAKKVERSPSAGNRTRSEPKPNSADIRQNIKKSLFDILKSRSENSEDLKMHPDSIMRLAAKIEDSLFKVYADTNMKYKNKYRSMMFNLKDTRNQGLWRKVIIGDVTTAEFVLMTAEQMASKKLAEWRKNELTQELDIIKKQEKEIANIRPVAKITHKGEIAIQEDLSDLTENFSMRETAQAPTIAPTRKKRISLSEEDPFEGAAASHTQDTTSQHQDHLFDLNCKICTGRVKEEDLEPAEISNDAAKKVKRSTSIILSSEAQNTPTDEKKDETPTSHIVISEKPRSKKKKMKLEEEDIESSISSHDPSLSPTSFLSNLSKEKKKKPKPTLPSPPPLSDIADRQPESESVTEASETTTPESAKTEEKPKEVVEPKLSPEVPTPPEQPPKPTKSKLIWSGSISMLDLSTFKANVYPVNGVCENLDIDLPVRLVLGGRIHPKVVWDYLGKISVLPTKQLSVVRFHAASDDDRVGYVAMLSYFSSRKRFGVVNNQDRMLVKDMYLIPLLESHPIPEQLSFCSPGINSSLPDNRPSMLLGIVVRQISPKALKPIVPVAKQSSSTSRLSSSEKASPNPDDDEEYIPDEDPPIKERKLSPAPLLTDEELAAKTESKPSSGRSLLERNRSLAPSLRFFMRKQSEEEQVRKEQEKLKDDDDNRPYSPGEDIEEKDAENDEEAYDPEKGIAQDEDGDDEENEPYDPEKMYEEQEEYDPETAFAPESPSRNDDDAPYDPEDAEDLIKDSIDSNEVKELVEKQAFLERMQRELEEKKAKLAQVEQSLQKPTPTPDLVATPEKQEKPRIADPRLARRAAAQSSKKTSSKPDEPEMKPESESSASKATTAGAVSSTTSIATNTAASLTSVVSSNPSTENKSSTNTTISALPTKPDSTDQTTVQTAVQSPKPEETKTPDAPKKLDEAEKTASLKPAVDPLQTILSVLNMAQQKNTSSGSSVAGALKIFQKQSSPPPLPDSTTKSDPEDGSSAEKLKNDEKQSGGLVDYAPSPDSREDDSDVERKKSKKNDQKRHRSSSISSSSSREDSRRRHRHDDEKHHSKRHRRSRSRSPHRRSRHHHRHHDDHHRRHHDRSWSRDRRR